MDQAISQAIKSLRFPLIMGVVLIHSYPWMNGVGVQEIKEMYLPISYYISTVLSYSLASVSVPLFYLISGYLFFSSGWSLNIYIQKLKTRLRSLFVPYVSVTIFALVLIGLLQYIMPNIRTGSMKPIFSWSIEEIFIIGFWDGGNGWPYVGPLWFLRNLMVIVLISPLIRFIVKRLGIVYLPVVFLVWIINIVPDRLLFGLNISGICVGITFFSLGAYLSLKEQKYMNLFSRYIEKVHIERFLLGGGECLLVGCFNKRLWL